MKTRTSGPSLTRGLLFAAASFLAASAWPAGDPGQPATDRNQIEGWMPRLVGTFRIEGIVESPGESAVSGSEAIGGKADCLPIQTQSVAPGRTSAVECFLEMTRAQSSGDTSTPHSAVILYGYDLAEIGVRFTQVDDDGVAESGTAKLFDDTLISTSPCARTKEKCIRSVRITAAADFKSVKMTMATEVDGKRTGGHQITLHRVTTP